MPQPLIFVCFDSKLNDAAKGLGMVTLAWSGLQLRQLRIAAVVAGFGDQSGC